MEFCKKQMLFMLKCPLIDWISENNNVYVGLTLNTLPIFVCMCVYIYIGNWWPCKLQISFQSTFSLCQRIPISHLWFDAGASLSSFDFRANFWNGYFHHNFLIRREILLSIMYTYIYIFPFLSSWQDATIGQFFKLSKASLNLEFSFLTSCLTKAE